MHNVSKRKCISALKGEKKKSAKLCPVKMSSKNAYKTLGRLSLPRAKVQSLVRETRSCKPHYVREKKKEC